MLELSEHLKQHLPAGREFDAIMAMRGEVFREHKNRRTMRVDIGGRQYFLKIHGPTSWREILKNALRGRWPVLTARTEWKAIKRLEHLQVSTTPAAGMGVRGRWPGALESFLLTDALPNMTHLSDVPPRLTGLRHRSRAMLNRTMIEHVAHIARKLHLHGLNHRDFYLCHFMVQDREWIHWRPQDALIVHLIDLHRLQIRRNTPARWIIKDISGLLFSALDAGLTSRDYLRFLQAYWRAPWRERWARSGRWRRIVVRRAVSLYRSEHGRSPRLPAFLASSA
jgi:heptose I phosphotransferase